MPIYQSCDGLQQTMKKKIMLGTSDAWAQSHLSQRTSNQATYIVDCRILQSAVCPMES